jgi:CRP-like cAMP-binding protein
MPDDEIVNMLRNVEFFQGIADDDLRKAAGISKVVEFPGRHDIFHENEPAGDVYFIVSGRVSLIICSPAVGCRQLMECSDGELIGWSPLVGRALLSDTAQTITATKLIAMDGQRVLALCRQDPQFGFEFMHRAAEALAARLNAARMQLMKMSGRLLPEAQIESD